MKKNNILIITYYWPPSGGAGVQRWVKFCKYLPDFDIQPIVLTVKNGTYPLVDESLLEQVPDSLPVYRSSIIEPYSIFAKLTGKSSEEVSTPASAFSKNQRLVQRFGVWIRANFFIPDARRGWVFSSVRKAQRIIRKHNINTVITSGPPNSTHLIGLKLKQKNSSLRWIMDMRDPWSKIFFNQKIPRTKTAQNIDERLEKKALKTADEVIVVTEGMRKIQKMIYEREYHLISNGFDHTDFILEKKSTAKDFFTIKYVGSMTDAAIPYNFFKAVKKLPEITKNQLKIEFYGSFNSSLQSVVEESGIKELVSINTYLPHLLAKQEMTTADLLLLVIPDTEDNELIIAGKIFDYIGAQTPIICIGPEDGDAANLIKQHKLGMVFSHSDIDVISEWLYQTINGSNSYLNWSGDFKSHPFSRFSLTEKLSKIINKK